MTLEIGAVTQYESRSFLVLWWCFWGWLPRFVSQSWSTWLSDLGAGAWMLLLSPRFQLGYTQVLSSYGFPPNCSLFFLALYSAACVRQFPWGFLGSDFGVSWYRWQAESQMFSKSSLKNAILIGNEMLQTFYIMEITPALPSLENIPMRTS